MEAAFAELQPDLVLREPCEYAAAILAARCGVAQAQVAISQGKIETSALKIASPALETFERGIVGEIGSSPYLTRFPASLDPVSYADTRRYQERRDRRGSLANWWPGDARPLAYMTFGSITGTMSIAPDVYQVALEVAGMLPARVLLTVGRKPGTVLSSAVPPNVRVEAWVPQEDVFSKASLVINHGGSGTVFGALAAGLPQVIVPLFADHFRNARQIEAAGAGLCVEIRSDKTDGRAIQVSNAAARIAEAATTVLDDPAYKSAARLIGHEMARLLSVGQVLNDLRDEVALKSHPRS
jgi:UDP:flavonoid glycosyltransferase YjiC (YdhE family)